MLSKLFLFVRAALFFLSITFLSSFTRFYNVSTFPITFIAPISQRITISCSEQDANIFVDGMQVGNGSTKITVKKGECVNVKITKVGFVTVERNYCDKKRNVLPAKDFIKLEVDQAYTSSISTKISNVDITLRVENPGVESWKTLNNIILSYFDVIELTDRETSYLRTAWAIQTFNSTVTIRTRFIVKSDPNGYKVKLVSEISNSTNRQTDEYFSEWDRVLRKYDNLITDLQSRVK